MRLAEMSFDIVIGIPTFRRPEQLAALLQSLLPELQAQPALVIVGDNDCGESAPRIVDAFRSQWPHAVCIPVAERGVAQVRNALVREACASRPAWRWLVMLDDDGLATPGWLKKLLTTGETLRAHLVGGPVEGPRAPASRVILHHGVAAVANRLLEVQ